MCVLQHIPSNIPHIDIFTYVFFIVVIVTKYYYQSYRLPVFYCSPLYHCRQCLATLQCTQSASEARLEQSLFFCAVPWCCFSSGLSQKDGPSALTPNTAKDYGSRVRATEIKELMVWRLSFQIIF